MKSKKLWIFLIVILVLAGVGYMYRTSITQLVTGQNQAQASEATPTTGTVAIRPATDASQVSAAGNIALAGQQFGVLQVDGVVNEVTVDSGDTVAAGDVLVTLDTTDLERAIKRVELDIATKQLQLDKLQEPAEPADIAAAQANLASAKENLLDLKNGPSGTELAAAEAALYATQQRYQELKDGKSEAELTQLSVELHKSFLTLQQAQEAYNEIAFQDNIGGTNQAMELQNATIDYDAAKASYDIATQPASPADLQDAIKSIRDAENQLATLKNPASAADFADAEAKIAVAEAELAQLLTGPTTTDVQEAELALQQSQLDLEEAQANLAQANLVSPVAGTILTVDVEPGQKVTAGFNAMTLTDLSELELTVNVAEVDIPKIQLDQPTNITIDALPDRAFKGVVSKIALSSTADGGVVNYPVTIKLNKLDLEGVLPGMTAVATISDDSAEPGWLVPTNALVEFEGETTIVVMHNGQSNRVTVIPGASQGEWTVVQSPDLKAGDKVAGEVSSFLDEEGEGNFRGPFGPPRP